MYGRSPGRAGRDESSGIVAKKSFESAEFSWRNSRPKRTKYARRPGFAWMASLCTSGVNGVASLARSRSSNGYARGRLLPG